MNGSNSAASPLGRDADPGVGHLEAHDAGAVRAGSTRTTTSPAGGELDRVGQQVAQHLAPARRRRRAPDDGSPSSISWSELDALRLRRRREHLARLLDEQAQVEVVHVEREPPGLDLREVEHVVDDAEQRVAGGERRADVAVLLVASSAVPSSSWSIPITPLSGVRISWLMLATKSDLARLADCAASRASSSAASVSRSSRSSSRSAISVITACARSRTVAMSSAVQSRGSWSIAQKLPEHLPAGRHQRHAEVGDHAEVRGSRGCRAGVRHLARVGDHQRLARAHDVLAERVRQRRPAAPTRPAPGGRSSS